MYGSPIFAATEAMTTTRPGRAPHRGQRPAQAPERRGEVEVEHPLPLLVRRPHRSGHARAGIGDEHLDRAEPVLDLPEELLGEGGLREVTGHDERRPGAGRSGPGQVRPAPRGERDRVPGAAERDRDGPTDPASGARHEGHGSRGEVAHAPRLPPTRYGRQDSGPGGVRSTAPRRGRRAQLAS